MVSLPVSRQTNSSTSAVNCDSDSPVLRSARISTIMGTITFIQPERITDNVPSKSKSTTRALRAETPGLTFSTIQVHFTVKLRFYCEASDLLLELLHNGGEAEDGGRDDDADGTTQNGCVPQRFTFRQDG